MSQAVDEGGYLGQGLELMLKNQKWHSAADAAAIAVSSLIDKPLSEPGVLNINVPNLEKDDIVVSNHRCHGHYLVHKQANCWLRESLP